MQLGKLLVNVASVFVAADDRLMKHLEQDSESLQQQLGQEMVVRMRKGVVVVQETRKHANTRKIVCGGGCFRVSLACQDCRYRILKHGTNSMRLSILESPTGSSLLLRDHIQPYNFLSKFRSKVD